MNLKTDAKVLECLLAVHLDVKIWSARRKLSPEDFSHAELPPEGLASLGSKKICDPKELKVFGTLKSRAVSLLSKSGVRFLGGWAIPENNAQAIIAGLKEIECEFNQAKTDFISRYDQTVQQWISENVGWEKIITNSTVDASYVKQKISYAFQVFKVVNPPNCNSSHLENEVRTLGVTLFEEVAKTAQDAWHKSYMRKIEITRKALSPLKQIMTKLNDLSFVEPKVLPVVNLIHATLEMIPKRGGSIKEKELHVLQGLVLLLSNTKRLLENAQQMLDGRAKEHVLDSILQDYTMMIPEKIEVKDKQDVKPPAQALPSLGLW